MRRLLERGRLVPTTRSLKAFGVCEGYRPRQKEKLEVIRAIIGIMINESNQFSEDDVLEHKGWKPLKSKNIKQKMEEYISTNGLLIKPHPNFYTQIFPAVYKALLEDMEVVNFAPEKNNYFLTVDSPVLLSIAETGWISVSHLEIEFDGHRTTFLGSLRERGRSGAIRQARRVYHRENFTLLRTFQDIINDPGYTVRNVGFKLALYIYGMVGE